MGRVSLSATGYYRTPKIDWDAKTGQGRPFLYFAYGAAVSEVEIDTLTGANRVIRADILHDVGRSLNPDIDHGQIEGGFVQGMGWLTMEELVSWRSSKSCLTSALTFSSSMGSGARLEHEVNIIKDKNKMSVIAQGRLCSIKFLIIKTVDNLAY